MRSRKAINNIFAGLLYELVAAVCGFVLPRLILTAFGSDYNGLTSSITQFLGYASLMQAGIGGVTRAALYKPLADENDRDISAIVNATQGFLRKVSVIFALSLCALAVIYPFFVIDDFDWIFSASLVIILGISTFVQYFFGLTYQLLLTADQKQYVVSYVQIGTTILNTVIAAILIKCGASIHVVKLGSAVAFSLNPVIINLYCRRKYNLDKSVAPNKDAIKDRWDCFGLQIANFVTNNTDMFLLTVFSNVREVSVYTVYYTVTKGINSIVRACVHGLGNSFGDMFAKNEKENIRRNLNLYEEATFVISNFLLSVTAVMIVGFVHVYTTGITDADYIRPVFAYVLVAATLFGVYRIPYQAIVEAVGHFKQTRNGAIFEACLNIVISIVMIRRFGLVGVAIGTVCATVFRTFQYYTYMSKHIIIRGLWPLIKRLLLSALTFGLVIIISIQFKFSTPTSYIAWIIQAIPVALVALVVVIIVEIVFYRTDLKLMLQKVENAVKKK